MEPLDEEPEEISGTCPCIKPTALPMRPLDITVLLSYNTSYICKAKGVHMKTITVRLDNDLADDVARLQREGSFRNQSDVIREGLRALVAREQQRKLKENLVRYLLEHEALAETARDVEDRISLTEEALRKSLP